METFKIEIREILSKVVEVKAENLNIAFEKVSEQYRESNHVLDYSDFIEVSFLETSS